MCGTAGISLIYDTIALLNQDGFLQHACSMERVVLTPDFHKGSGIPVGAVIDAHGFIIPKAIGRDINCAMGFVATDSPAESFPALGRELDDTPRHVFFEGGRDIVFDEHQREAVMRHGLLGLDTKRPTKGRLARLISVFRALLISRQ